jgi:hypothetical protein
MRRRTLLKSVAALAAAPALVQIDRLGPSSALSDAQISTLMAMAEVVLPSALSRGDREAAVDRFASWVRNYKEGADRGHGYGDSRLSPPTGASPAARYPAQFAALDDAARSRGGTTFAALALPERRAVVESALSTPQFVNALPARPTGANLVADFMGMYFQSADATDLAYQRAIMRDTCRGLPGSEKEPEKKI